MLGKGIHDDKLAIAVRPACQSRYSQTAPGSAGRSPSGSTFVQDVMRLHFRTEARRYRQHRIRQAGLRVDLRYRRGDAQGIGQADGKTVDRIRN
jgi:hypothetical protein